MPRENEIGALWLKKGAKGEYMTGTVNGTKVVLFPVENKANEKQPDWRIFLSIKKDTPEPVGDWN